jgi:hypothetical protein
MRLKLDENLDVRLIPLMGAEGFDTDMVLAERLSSRPDETIKAMPGEKHARGVSSRDRQAP